MGLCKCRVVTNLFCFEHKTNVCEKCIVSTHPRCVVKSYLQWLQDSDYDNACSLCHESLASGDVVRLACLDLYHKECLDKYASALPEHTAPSGYQCPKCGVPIIPAENSASPLAQGVRAALKTSSWAKPILGLHEVVASGAVAGSSSKQGAAAGTQPGSAVVAPVLSGSSVAAQAIQSRKQQSSLAASAASFVPVPSSATNGLDADEEFHKYKQRKSYFTRLLQMSFWHVNNQGELVLNVPRLLLFLFFVSILVVGFVLYNQNAVDPGVISIAKRVGNPKSVDDAYTATGEE